MQVVETKAELKEALPEDKRIGFVPTMGALHDGHVSLVKASVERKLFTVASIFINPTQFNDPKDFERYPIDTDRDLQRLEAAGCDMVFLPSRSEIYPSKDDDGRYIHDFGELENRLEGAFRPGHFRGVGQVVHILFEAVEPDVAFFGEKDFQQLQVIRRLVDITGMSIEIVGMPTVRESDGLAMSSRNRRLSADERTASVLLYKALTFAKESIGDKAVNEIKRDVEAMFAATDRLRLEYFDIIDPASFLSRKKGDTGPHHAVIAAYAGEVRLIDNMRLD